jgi:hypothetical protein
MLYVREANSQIEIKRTKSYGNAGDQIKVNGTARIENSLMVSNCGYFNGKSFTYNVDDCRAGGSALVFSMRRGSTVSVVNSTLAGQGDCLLIVQCDTEALPACNGSEIPIVQNNIFQGHPEFGTDDTTCYVWFDRDNFYLTQEDYNVIHDTKLGAYQYGSHDIFQNPLFVNANLETFDGHLQAGSPAIDTGLPVGSLSGLIPLDDLTGATRPSGSGVDRGAYEMAEIIYVAREGSCAGKIPCFSSIQGGINAANNSVTIEITQETYDEDVVLNSPKQVTLRGGWDLTFTTIQSNTTINGSLTISNGKLIVEKIILE